MFKWMYKKAAKDVVDMVDEKIGPTKELLSNSDSRMSAGIVITSLGVGFIISSFIGKE